MYKECSDLSIRRQVYFSAEGMRSICLSVKILNRNEALFVFHKQNTNRFPLRCTFLIDKRGNESCFDLMIESKY